jgi:hypothetical protein
VAPAVPTQSVPTQSAIEACNQYAASQAGQRNKTMDTVKDAGIGAVAGAALGAAGGAIADGGKGAGKGAAIGGLVGAGGGTLYGLNENQKHDERYRNAYGARMRAGTRASWERVNFVGGQAPPSAPASPHRSSPVPADLQLVR